MDNPQLPLSPSVEKTLKLVGPENPVSAAALAQAIFRVHPEYADSSAASLQLEETPSIQKGREWVDEVQTLIDPGRIRELSKSSEPPVLHGRLLVIGLTLLEPRLREQLERVGVFTALVKKLQEPFPEILTRRGQTLFKQPGEPFDPLANRSDDPPVNTAQQAKPSDSIPNRSDNPLADTAPKAEPPDSVPTWPDDPLQKMEEDLLGRAAFARFLAKRIAAVPPESGAYAIHVYGPWGAGKSTLLNFLHKALKGTGKWLVVEFNAWRHQQIQPPWWSLMECVFKETKKRLSVLELCQEYWWRFKAGRVQYLVGLILLAWLLAYVVFPVLRSEQPNPGFLASLAANAEGVSKILALVATIWGGILAVNRSLLLGGAQAARNYTELAHDPTSEIKRRFTGLVKKLMPERVAILIDDLDRCQSRYVVELLEGMQTLFREAPVVFVVAADRQWLNACYEEVYEKLEPRVYEPGKPLGTLFLEKAFRFSTPMPGIPDQLKELYWRYLLQLAPDQESMDVVAVRARVRGEMASAQSEGDVRRLVDDSRERSFPEQQALREEAVVRLASPEIHERLEHTLKPYAPLLEPNPRAMKLLVNAYSANRALAILSAVEIDLPQLVLWTILSSRWPQLSDHLTEHPDMLEKIGQQGSSGFPDPLKALCNEQSVIQVVKGNSTHAPLSIDTLKQCARMQ